MCFEYILFSSSIAVPRIASSDTPGVTMSIENLRASDAVILALREELELARRENICLRETLRQARRTHDNHLRHAQWRCAICGSVRQGTHPGDPAAASSTEAPRTGYELGLPAGERGGPQAGNNQGDQRLPERTPQSLYDPPRRPQQGEQLERCLRATCRYFAHPDRATFKGFCCWRCENNSSKPSHGRYCTSRSNNGP